MLERIDRKWVRISIYYAIALGLSFMARIVWQTSNLTDPRHGAWDLTGISSAAWGPSSGRC